MNYDPKVFFEKIKYDPNDLKKKKGNDNFHQSLKKEYVPMKLLNYYLSSGLLKENEINLS